MAAHHKKKGTKRTRNAAKKPVEKPRSDAPKRMLNQRDLMMTLRLSQARLYTMRMNGLPFETVGRQLLFDLDATKVWIAEFDKKEEEEKQRQAEMVAAAHAEIMEDGTRITPIGEIGEVRAFLTAEREALTLGNMRRELIPRAEVLSDYRAMFGVLRQMLLGLSSSITRSAKLSPTQQSEVESYIRRYMSQMQEVVGKDDLKAELSALEAKAA